MQQANPFAPLIRMIEMRVTRQEASLKETTSQLDSARASAAEWEAKQTNLPLNKK